MTDTGDHFVDRAHRPGPTDAVARVDLHRSRQAAFAGEVHPDAAALAAKLARAMAEPSLRPVVPAASPLGRPGTDGPPSAPTPGPPPGPAPEPGLPHLPVVPVAAHQATHRAPAAL